MTEEEKLNKAGEGDLKYIEELCSSTWEVIYRFIYFKVQNRQEAEDITQETYVRALSHLKKSSIKIDQYIGFLKTVSLNILRDKWRRKKRWGTSVDMEAIGQEKTAVEDPAEASVVRTLVQNALSSLTEDQRTVIELRILKGYSVAEAAKIMNKKEGTIRVLQYRALEAMARSLETDSRESDRKVVRGTFRADSRDTRRGRSTKGGMKDGEK